MMKFVNVYEVTRHYGGPEEGGWYYNRLHCVEVYPVRDEAAGETIIEYLEEQHKHRKHGNIYSVLGGTDLEIYFEDEPKESETRERPQWE
jgi:hypothetical protein